MKFNPVTQQTVQRLITICGAEHVRADADTLALHASDETEDLRFMPEVVVFPDTPEQISAVLKLANHEHIAVTPRGAGTGLSGGALAVHGGIVIAMKRFNRIRELDERNLFMVVEPGVTTQQVQDAAAAKGLFYPPDPASKGSCFIGGNVAENSGGPRAVKYGVTKDYVYGVEAVLPNGDILRTGGKLLKNVSGYNLTQLIVGSEGTLAVVTAVTLKLIPAVAHRKTMMAAFDKEETAAVAVTHIFNARVTPCALEFMERAAIDAVCDHLSKDVPNRHAAAQLLIEVDGNDEDQLWREIETISGVCQQLGALDIVIAENRAKQDELWSIRRAIGEAVKSISPYKEEDTVVPRAELPKLVAGVRAIAQQYGFTAISYGHAGDGNLHVNILKKDLSDRVWNEELPKAVREIFKLTVSLGGQISGEHGIGYVQKQYLPIACSAPELAAMRAIKIAWDPRGILNPGKIFES